MNANVLKHLGLSPAQTVHITGQRRTRLINFLLRWEVYGPALDCLESMLHLNPGLVGLLDAKARALLGLDRPAAAREVIAARHEIRSSFNSRRLEAQIHLALVDSATALAIAQEMVSESPDSITAWGLLGEVHLARRDFDAALSAYRRVADLNASSRAYLLGMLSLHQAQDDHVTASGYAVRLQRSAADDRPLPATTLRRLRNYYQSSGETNRVEDMQAALAALYESELAELEAALADDLRVLTRRPDHPPPGVEAALGVPEGTPAAVPDAEPMPAPDVTPVTDQERQGLEERVRELFGHQRLLPGQAETITAVLRDQDVLTILPTGGGKSLCYQLPAVLDEGGTTLVVSPLIALMKDQVDSLPPAARGRATTINSSLEGQELQRRMRAVAAGRYRLIYAAPERLRQPPFLHALRRAGLNRLVIDEAHCVSVWGHDFRPDYLHIAQARHALGNPPLLAMTATAPPRVRRDILQRLAKSPVGEPGPTDAVPGSQQDGIAVVAGDAYRPNLYLAAVQARNADEKLQHLLALCQAETGSGIIYAGTRARCERIAALLQGRDIAAGYYHAGIGDRGARAAAQDRFMSGEVRVMVATVAFGMGIDKADIRFIIHMQLPPSLEAYYQEAGRAGRDGLPARCVLIYAPADRATLTRRARRDALPVEFLRAVYAAVKRRLGDESLGRMACGDLMRDVRAEDTPVRVALSILEEAGLLRRHQDLPATAIVRLQNGRSARQDDPEYASFITAARLRPGQSLPLDIVDVARTAGLDPAGVELKLLTWADAGWVDYRPAGRELLLELLPPPADAPARVEGLIDRYVTIQAQRVDEIAAYAMTRRCRHGHIGAYLSGRPMEACQSCDNCQQATSPVESSVAALDLPGEREQLQKILRCVADAPGGWGRANLTYILRANARASQRGQQSPHWGALAFRSRAAVEGLVERLITADLLRLRQLDHGGVILELTSTGRAALKDPTRLGPLVSWPATIAGDSNKQVADDAEDGPVDATLFERLRAWRLETARAAGVAPYVIAHDALLRRIAALQPRDEAELVAIKGMGPKKLAQYGAAILDLVTPTFQ